MTLHKTETSQTSVNLFKDFILVVAACQKKFINNYLDIKSRNNSYWKFFFQVALRSFWKK